jgi:hypothetical protein
MSAQCRFFAARQGQDSSIFCRVRPVADSRRCLGRPILGILAPEPDPSGCGHSILISALPVTPLSPLPDGMRFGEFAGLNLSAVPTLPLREAVFRE